MTLLASLLAIDAALHALLVYRFGIKENMGFLVYVFIYAALAVAVLLDLPYALWLALVLSVIGFVGLTVRFNQPQRDKTIDKGIWVADLAAIVCAIYLLFVR
jgi:hypothetical protein